MLRREGWRVGKRHIQRLRTGGRAAGATDEEEDHSAWGLDGVADQSDASEHVWTWDFIADATVRGGALRMLTILDEYTRECHVLWAERALRRRMCLDWLKKAMEATRGPGISAQ